MAGSLDAKRVERDPTFLTVDDVLLIHADQLAAFGGGNKRTGLLSQLSVEAES